MMRLRADAASISTSSDASKAGGPSADVEQEYRERINRLAGREVIADPARAAPPTLDSTEELTEEEEIERIMRAVQDDLRLDVLGAFSKTIAATIRSEIVRQVTAPLILIQKVIAAMERKN